MIREITYEETLPLWQALWPGRDDIRNMSSMTRHDPEDWDMSIYERYTPNFFGYFTDDTDELVGVNSCHPSSDTRMRSRGLYVKPDHRGQGIAQALLQHTIDHARANGFTTIWTIPRQTAISTYTGVGFVELGDPIHGDSYPVDGVMTQGTYYNVEMNL